MPLAHLIRIKLIELNKDSKKGRFLTLVLHQGLRVAGIFFKNLNNPMRDCIICKVYQEGRIISRRKLNEYLETLDLAPMYFCDIPGFYHKTGVIRSHPLSLRVYTKWKGSLGLPYI